MRGYMAVPANNNRIQEETCAENPRKSHRPPCNTARQREGAKTLRRDCLAVQGAIEDRLEQLSMEMVSVTVTGRRVTKSR